MDKKTELQLLRRYAEIRRLYEQTNTLSVLMDELYTADLTSSYFTDEIRQLAGKIAPDAYRLKTLLTTVEHQLLTQLTELQFTLRLSLEKSAMCDLLLETYSREDVPDLAAAIQLTTL